MRLGLLLAAIFWAFFELLSLCFCRGNAGIELNLLWFESRSTEYCLLLPVPAMPGVPRDQGWPCSPQLSAHLTEKGWAPTQQKSTHDLSVCFPCLLPVTSLSETLDWVLHKQIFWSVSHHFVACTSQHLLYFLFWSFSSNNIPVIDRISLVALLQAAVSFFHLCG